MSRKTIFPARDVVVKGFNPKPTWRNLRDGIGITGTGAIPISTSQAAKTHTEINATGLILSLGQGGELIGSHRNPEDLDLGDIPDVARDAALLPILQYRVGMERCDNPRSLDEHKLTFKMGLTATEAIVMVSWQTFNSRSDAFSSALIAVLLTDFFYQDVATIAIDLSKEKEEKDAEEVNGIKLKKYEIILTTGESKEAKTYDNFFVSFTVFAGVTNVYVPNKDITTGGWTETPLWDNVNDIEFFLKDLLPSSTNKILSQALFKTGEMKIGIEPVTLDQVDPVLFIVMWANIHWPDDGVSYSPRELIIPGNPTAGEPLTLQVTSFFGNFKFKLKLFDKETEIAERDFSFSSGIEPIFGSQQSSEILNPLPIPGVPLSPFTPYQAMVWKLTQEEMDLIENPDQLSISISNEKADTVPLVFQTKPEFGGFGPIAIPISAGFATNGGKPTVVTWEIQGEEFACSSPNVDDIGNDPVKISVKNVFILGGPGCPSSIPLDASIGIAQRHRFENTPDPDVGARKTNFGASKGTASIDLIHINKQIYGGPTPTKWKLTGGGVFHFVYNGGLLSNFPGQEGNTWNSTCVITITFSDSDGPLMIITYAGHSDEGTEDNVQTLVEENNEEHGIRAISRSTNAIINDFFIDIVKGETNGREMKWKIEFTGENDQSRVVFFGSGLGTVCSLSWTPHSNILRKLDNPEFTAKLEVNSLAIVSGRSSPTLAIKDIQMELPVRDWSGHIAKLRVEEARRNQ